MVGGKLGDRMKRREFITRLGGMAAAWPLAARAQQALPTICFSGPTTGLLESQAVTAFVQRLHAVGWIEGRAAAIKVRWAEGRSERAAEIVAKFVRQKVDVIVCRGTASVLAKQATSVIPIVFAGGDPVGTGLIVVWRNRTAMSRAYRFRIAIVLANDTNSCATLSLLFAG